MRKVFYLFILFLFSNTLSAQPAVPKDTVLGISIKQVSTPYGFAIQSLSPSALEVRKQILKGNKTLYRLGTNGKSAPPEKAQFWSAEDPRIDSADYARKYGIPLENVIHADYLVEAVLNDTTDFITREAPPAPGQTTSAGGIEVVVPPGSLRVVNTIVYKKQ